MDKIGKGVSTVANKTSDAFDVGVIRGKISTENGNIEKKKTEIGDFYWNKYSKGGKIDPDAKALFDAIEESNKKIADYEKQIEEIKSKDPKAEEANKE